MTEKLDDSFIRGYTKAVLDIQHFLENHSDSLKHNHLYNYAGITELIAFIKSNRQELCETGDIADIVCRKDKKKVIIEKVNHEETF